MNPIPESLQITNEIHQKQYLVNGELIEWTGPTSEVYSTISSTETYQPTLLGSIPTNTEKEALEALDAALGAWDQGARSVAHNESKRPYRLHGEVCKANGNQA